MIVISITGRAPQAPSSPVETERPATTVLSRIIGPLGRHPPASWDMNFGGSGFK